MKNALVFALLGCVLSLVGCIGEDETSTPATSIYEEFVEQVPEGRRHVLRPGEHLVLNGVTLEFIGLPLVPTFDQILLGIGREASELELRSYTLQERDDGGLYGVIESDHREPWQKLYVLEAMPTHVKVVVDKRE